MWRKEIRDVIERLRFSYFYPSMKWIEQLYNDPKVTLKDFVDALIDEIERLYGVLEEIEESDTCM